MSGLPERIPSGSSARNGPQREPEWDWAVQFAVLYSSGVWKKWCSMSVEDPNQRVHAVSRLCGAFLVNFNRCLQRRSRHSTRMWPSTGSSQPKHLGSDPVNTNLYQRKKGCKGALFGFSFFFFMFNSHLAILAHSYLDVGRFHFVSRTWK